MAYLTKKKVNGIFYYYAEERKRINGKVKRSWQKYLGTIEKIITAVEAQRESPNYAIIFELGAAAAYWNVIQKANLLNLLDSFFPKRKQGLTIGLYLLLAAINRGINVSSKRGMWEWFQSTILLRTLPHVKKSDLNSQRFWDNMSLIQEDKLQDAWLKIINHVIDQEKIDLSCTSFDGTNFYSFISSFNTRCSMPKRGKNKQGRKDLRQINYALFCTRIDHFPLYFDVFDGNRHDSKEFGTIIEKFMKAFKNREIEKGGMTVVFDKGNNSMDNINKFVNGSTFHFVGSVKPDDHKDLALISNQDDQFIPCKHPKLESVKAYRTQKKIYNKKLTVIVTFNNNLYSTQVKSINNVINKCLEKLFALATKLDDRRAGRVKKGKKPTVESVNKQVKTILSGQHMKKLIDIKIHFDNGVPILEYALNNAQFAELADTYLGKNIIITDNHDWKTDEIILTYRSQFIIENSFREMKDRKTGTWWPMYHWTDQKIKVHGFYCSLTMLMRALIMKRLRQSGLSMSMNRLHQELSGLKEVLNIFSKGSKKTQSVISKMNKIQGKLFRLFEMSNYLES